MPDKPAHWYALAGLVIVLDQLSKWVVLNHIQFGETIYVAPFWNWVLVRGCVRLDRYRGHGPLLRVGCGL